MQGRVDTSFQTVQRDLFSSGLAAQIGMNAFGIWLAIKSHADFETGRAWPGMRRLAELTGLSLGSVSNSVQTLIDAKLLRVVEQSRGKGRRGQTYVARERLDIRLGEIVVCTVVLDYVPSRLRGQVSEIDRSLKGGKVPAEVFAECEVIPGPGFAWDGAMGALRASLPASGVPELQGPSLEQVAASPILRRIEGIAKRARAATRAA